MEARSLRLSSRSHRTYSFIMLPGRTGERELAHGFVEPVDGDC